MIRRITPEDEEGEREEKGEEEKEEEEKKACIKHPSSIQPDKATQLTATATTTPSSTLSVSSSSVAFTNSSSYRNEIESLPETYRLLVHVFSVGVSDIILAYAHQVLPMRYKWRKSIKLSPAPSLEVKDRQGNDDDDDDISSEKIIQAMMDRVRPWLVPDGELACAVDAVRDATTLEEWKRTGLHCHSVALRLWASTQTSVRRKNTSKPSQHLLLKYVPTEWRSHAKSLSPPIHMGYLAVALARVVAAEACVSGSGLMYAKRVQAFWSDLSQWFEEVILYTYSMDNGEQNLRGDDSTTSYSKRDTLHTLDITSLHHIHPLEVFVRLGVGVLDGSFISRPDYLVSISTRYTRHFDWLSARCAYALVVCSLGNYNDGTGYGIYRSKGLSNILALNTRLNNTESMWTLNPLSHWSRLTHRECVRAYKIYVLSWSLFNTIKTL